MYRIIQAYKQLGNRVKGVKRKLEEIIPSLPKKGVRSPNLDAPSPSSSASEESDVEIVAFVQAGRGVAPNRRPPKNNLLSQGVGLNSRITSFLAENTRAVAVSNINNFNF